MERSFFQQGSCKQKETICTNGLCSDFNYDLNTHASLHKNIGFSYPLHVIVWHTEDTGTIMMVFLFSLLCEKGDNCICKINVW